MSSPFRQETNDLLRLAAPVMGGLILSTSMVFVDNMMVGRIGADALAALAMASSIYMFVFVFCIGVLLAMTPLISQADGEGDKEKMAVVLDQSLWVTFFLALGMGILFYISEPIFHWMNQEERIIPLAGGYLRILAWGTPGLLGFICLRNFIDSTSNTKPAFWIALIATAINAGLDYIFIFGKFGFPAMGVAGAALCTTTVYWGMTLALGIYIFRSKRYRDFPLFQTWRTFHWPTIREILGLGLPLGFTRLTEVGLFAAATLLMGTLGAFEQAGHQVALNAASLVFMIPLGLSIASAVRIGKYVGARNSEMAETSGSASMFVTIVIGIFLALLFLFFPRQITLIYTDDLQVMRFATEFIFVAAFFQVVDGLQCVLGGMLRGLKDTRVPFFINFVSYWVVGLPAGYLLTFRWGGGAKGLWIGMVFGLGASAILSYIRYRALSKRIFSKLRRPSGSSSPQDGFDPRGNKENSKSDSKTLG